MTNAKRGIIFDFDGVLADTQGTALKVISRIAHKKNVTTPSMEFLKNHKTQEILKALHIRWWEIPYYVALARKWAFQEEPVMSLFPWSIALLQSAQEAFCQVWIVSSNSSVTIHQAFTHARYSFEPSQIHGDIGVFGKSRKLKEIIRREKLDPGQVLYIGDETRDIDAAKAAGVKSVCVGWGYQSEALLMSLSPDFFTRTPGELESMMTVRSSMSF